MIKQRLSSLDYLRGFAALSIMLHHYSSWSDVSTIFDNLLDKLGYYGVEVFYVLSGYTLAFVYLKQGLKTKKSVLKFYIKRVFRIFPLLWLVSLVTILLEKEVPSLEIMLVNLTGVFSVYKIDSYIAVGAWSIGNEIFFYLCFPILLFLKHKYQIILAAILIIGLFIVFLIPDFLVTREGLFIWKSYISPLNHLLFFFAGITLYNNRDKLTRLKNPSRLILLLILMILILLPYGERTDLVIGFSRIFYSILMLTIVALVVNLNEFKNSLLHKISDHLGKISYSLYLVHPLVWGIYGYFNLRVSFIRNIDIVEVRILICVIMSIIASTLIYKYLEIKFIALGKQLTKTL